MQLIHRFIRYQERVSGVPGRFIAPVLLAGVSLQVAVLGMYWDIGYHIDHGRDQGVFTAPHMFIVVGLQGIVLAALLHGRMGGPAARNERRLPLRQPPTEQPFSASPQTVNPVSNDWVLPLLGVRIQRRFTCFLSTRH